jgi:hypothetical protein
VLGVVRVDGRLDDACWNRAQTAADFRVWDPDRGARPSEETAFKVACDEHAVYFAIACFEQDPSRIARTLSRRDQLTNSDYASVYIDPYCDRTTGYNFRFNPLGIQQDRYVYDDGETDMDWDAVWEAETYDDVDGWYAEIRIPFSSIRYRAAAATWGLQVQRYMHSRGEDLAWNLSPYETQFEEKRPFFIEGNRFFAHPAFTLFYSRRIGTGDENSRIRYAGKLTGKTAGDISVAALVAGTDITGEDQNHNFLKGGTHQSTYFVGRFGKEFAGGRRGVNVMQTTVVNHAAREAAGNIGSREAYTTGIDFALQLADRTYRIDGAFVGSVIDPEAQPGRTALGGSRSHGTGGELSASRHGKPSGGAWFRWESGRLDLNDIGFLQAPDEMGSGAWLSRQVTPDGKSSWLNRGEVNFNFHKSWLFGGRTGLDLHTNRRIWRYSEGHRAFSDGNVNGWMQFRNFAEAWLGISYTPESTQCYETRSPVRLASGGVAPIPGGGPLIDEPTTYGGWWGGSTDTRKDLVLTHEGSHFRDVAENHLTNLWLALRWNQTSAIRHEIGASFSNRVDDTQHLGNLENEGGGIGGVSYVFGKIHQRTLDLTLRTNLLFSRHHSLELYAQPFISIGDYTNARELIRPDSYDLVPYTRDGFRAEHHDFSSSAVNMNLVYRWEYRPGSTLFLVWTHSRSSYREAGSLSDRGSFDNRLDGATLFDNEPENVFLVKATYWLPI